VTNTTYLASVPTSAADEPVKRAPSLSTMKLAELQGLAGSLGLTGTAKLRKGDLVAAIRGRQSGALTQADSSSADSTPAADAPAVQAPAAAEQRSVRTSRRAQRPGRSSQGDEIVAPVLLDQVAPDQVDQVAPVVVDQVATVSAAPQAISAEDSANDDGRQLRRNDNRQNDNRQNDNRQNDNRQNDNRQNDNRQNDNRQNDNRQNDNRQQGGRQNNRQNDNRGQGGQNDNRGQGGQNDNRGQGGQNDNRGQGGQNDNRGQGGQNDNRGQGGQNDNRGQGGQNDNRGRFDQDDESPGGRRRNRQRSRDRKRRGGQGEGSGGQGQGQNENVEAIHEDDVLLPVAGILEVLDNYAFLRTSGYLPGENDVYVPLGIVKKNDLRKGDAVTGAVRALREGEQIPARQKFNALVRLDTINGLSPDQSLGRVHFNKLTPLYPQERLRLETESNILSTRLIDLIAPIGKGQRGLIVSPAKAGKTLILQAIANAITTNNPEAHLMVVLVDERPEEVTDMQRAVKGEVIASTFDRPATDHTTVAELAIERAKRLVEMGHDVVILLDSITRLGRAYNLAAPASGRILSGGVDSSALYPPKRFFGAARNIENGGSLTILATALVDTGSKMDEVIFEEFKGTGNMELRLSRHLAERRIFPAIDVNPSGTRREEILMANEELKIVWKLRRVLSALDQQQGIELLIDRLKKSKSNVEFLMQVQKTSSIQMDEDD
jgi:transcription termination factor Rho